MYKTFLSSFTFVLCIYLVLLVIIYQMIHRNIVKLEIIYISLRLNSNLK